MLRELATAATPGEQLLRQGLLGVKQQGSRRIRGPPCHTTRQTPATASHLTSMQVVGDLGTEVRFGNRNHCA